MASIPLDNVLDALRSVGVDPRKNGRGYYARCPAHDDHKPSLSIAEGEQGVVIHCHAGCPPEAILEAIGLKLHDLFSDTEQHPQPVRMVPFRDTELVYDRAWQYHKETGEVAAEVRRFHIVDSSSRAIIGKTFRQYRVVDGKALPGVGDLQLPLYRLPAVKVAVAEGKEIWTCEGEKDADTLITLGVCGTCNAGGAGKFKEHHVESLRGAVRVVVVADDDEPGHKHARDVMDKLRAVGVQVEGRLPQIGCKDVTEHVAAGYGLADLRLFDPSPAEQPQDDLGVEFLDIEAIWDNDSTERYIVEPLIAEGRLIAVYSPPKTGKSLLMLEIAAAVACGREVLGQATTARVVLYIDFENSPNGDIVPRLKAMGYSRGDFTRLRYLSFPSLSALDTEKGGQQLLKIVQYVGAELVVIDTISRAVEGEENNNDTWLNLYRSTGVLLKSAGVACIRLDHAGKDEARGQRGGSAKSGDVDAVWRLSETDDGLFELVCEATRFPIETDRIVLRRDENPLRHRVMELADLVEERITAAIQRLVETDCPRPVKSRAFREHVQEHRISVYGIETVLRNRWNELLQPWE